MIIFILLLLLLLPLHLYVVGAFYVSLINYAEHADDDKSWRVYKSIMHMAIIFSASWVLINTLQNKETLIQIDSQKALTVDSF